MDTTQQDEPEQPAPAVNNLVPSGPVAEAEAISATIEQAAPAEAGS